MKKLLIPILLAVSVGAMAQTGQKPAAKKAEPKKIECAVMKGDMVDIAAATKAKLYADYKGRRYYFCCPGCPNAFKKDPAKYAKRPSLPSPKVVVKPAPKKKS